MLRALRLLLVAAAAVLHAADERSGKIPVVPRLTPAVSPSNLDVRVAAPSALPGALPTTAAVPALPSAAVPAPPAAQAAAPAAQAAPSAAQPAAAATQEASAGAAAGDAETADAGRAFDLTAKLPAFEAPDPTLPPRLARLAAQTAELRARRAAAGEGAISAEDASVLRGIDDLAAAAAMGRSTPAQLAQAAKVVEGMDVAKLKLFSKIAARFIDTDVPGRSTPFARQGNVEHVNQQLIEPLDGDGAELAAAFKTVPAQSAEHFVEMLKALQYATDTGKQENPRDMGAALARFNAQAETGPNWYVNNFILPHEYASMKWAAKFGRQAGFTDVEIAAFQRLIANHNFGPDLTDPRNAAMREHWWPKNFREQMIPMLRAMGVDVGALFDKDETGALQYNHAQGHRYALLLAAYDRAIAVKANGYGLATWRKYGVQDFNGKKGRLKGIREANAQRPPGEAPVPDPEGLKDEDGKPGALFEFDGPSVVRAMESAAGWAEQHVESLWASLYEALPAGSPARAKYADARAFRMFPPFYAQRKAIGSLLTVLRLTKASNPEGLTNRADVVPQAGVAYYEAQSPELAGLWRVSLKRVGPGAYDARSTEYSYQADIERYEDGRWQRHDRALARAGLADHGPDPVALYIDLIRKDRGW